MGTTGRLRRRLPRLLIGLAGLCLVAAIAMGVAYLTHGWHRLDTLPTPVLADELAPFRPYSEHAAVLGDDGFPYVLRMEPGPNAGAVLFFGSRHTQDPGDPQIARIEALWDEFQPTLALCESRLGLYIGGLSAGVKMFGEVSLPYALGRRDDVPVYSLEPSWENEIAAMLHRFDRREVAAFYFLRVFTSERAGRSGDSLEGLAASLLAKRTALPGLDNSFASLGDFDAWWDCTLRDELGDWRTMPAEAMWPTENGKTSLNRLALGSNRVRDEHIVRLLIDRVRQGERVFAVCGGSHALTIEPALRGALGIE